MSFYVTLPSNSSPKIYPDNNPSHFFVKLPQMIDLTSQYELGLAEIQVPSEIHDPNSYFNVRADEVWIEYTPPKDKIYGDSFSSTCRKTLPPGQYKSTTSLVNEVNRMILALEQGGDRTVKLLYDIQTKITALRLYEKGATFTVSKTLRNMLGLTSDQISDANPILYGTEPVDTVSEIKNVYVYCDLVASRPVGDVMVPLLRTVPILDRKSTSVYRIYDKPHYVPLSRFSFDTIEILLTTDTGQTISFASGNSVVTLHFRTRRRFDLE